MLFSNGEVIYPYSIPKARLDYTIGQPVKLKQTSQYSVIGSIKDKLEDMDSLFVSAHMGP